MANNIIEYNGYRLDPRATFERSVSPALLERAAPHKGNFVLWDPESGDDGFLLVGDDPAEMEREFVEYFGEYLAVPGKNVL